MAKTPKIRSVRFDQFKKQLAEVDVDSLQRVELSAEAAVYIRLGLNLGGDDGEFRDFMGGIEAADDAEQIAMLVLGYYPDASADEQWATFEAAGGEAHELVALWGASTAARRDELGKLRPRRS